jgi:hypothetical protein
MTALRPAHEHTVRVKMGKTIILTAGPGIPLWKGTVSVEKATLISRKCSGTTLHEQSCGIE